MGRHRRRQRDEDSVEERIRTIDEAKERYSRGRPRHRSHSPSAYAQQTHYMAGGAPDPYYASPYNPIPVPQFHPSANYNAPPKVATVYTASDSGSSDYYSDPPPRARAATPGRMYKPPRYEPHHHQSPPRPVNRTASWVESLPPSEQAEEVVRQQYYEKPRHKRARSHGSRGKRSVVPYDSPINKHSRTGDALNFVELLKLFVVAKKGGKSGKLFAVAELLSKNMGKSKDYHNRELREDRDAYSGFKEAMLIRLQDPNTWRQALLAWNNLKHGGKTAGFLALASNYMQDRGSKRDGHRSRGGGESGGLLGELLSLAMDPAVLNKIGKYMDRFDLNPDDLAVAIRSIGKRL